VAEGMQREGGGAAETGKTRQNAGNADRRAREVGDLVGAICFGALGAFAIFAAAGMPRRGNLGFFTSPGFVPLLLGVLLVVLSLILAYKAIRREAMGGVQNWLRRIKESEESRRVLVLVTLLTAYVALIGRVNFALLTFVFASATFFYVRAGKPWQVLVYALLLTALVAFGIPELFSMPMP
jgi:hypothetical protein